MGESRRKYSQLKYIKLTERGNNLINKVRKLSIRLLVIFYNLSDEQIEQARYVLEIIDQRLKISI